MSWAADDWTSGLSGRALQKVQDLQSYSEKLNKERHQRQLQLDNTEAALHKQKQKYEEVRVELAAVQRDLLGVREEAQAEARAKERLAQDLQAKAAQVCGLEGQLDSARTITQHLTQEVKRLEAELEKLQKGSASGESMLFSTPCWNMNSPWEQNGGKSVLRGESESKSHHIRQQLVFGDTPKPSAGGASSQLPQQPHQTPPMRRRVHQPEICSRSSVFPWERDDTRSTSRGRPASSSSSSSAAAVAAAAVGDVVAIDADLRDNGTEEVLRKERDEQRQHVSDLQRELQLLKDRLREAESRLAQAQKELGVKEQNLTHSRDELARAQTRVTQEGDRAQLAEQRVKQLQEELKCQRQNAETSRCNAEQRRKDLEREHQRELLELQRERQSMEKHHQQEINKLNQEIQQARALHNTLQAQHDKLVLQKQGVERDLQGAQAQLKSTQSDLTESRRREAQTLAKLTESLRENEGLTVSVEQLKKREKSLEAEVKRLTEELAEAMRLIKELEAKLVASPAQTGSHPFPPLPGDAFNPVLAIRGDRSPPLQNSTQRKRAPKPDKPRETLRAEILAYPSGREPAEGIESENSSDVGSEDAPKLLTEEHEGTRRGASRPSDMDIESSITEQDTGIEDTDTDSYMSDSTSERMYKDDVFPRSKMSTSSDQGQKRDLASLVDLKKENAALRDEVRDVKQELERRLEDLESQRRSEAEARTKLKQLSKKYSNQAEQHRTKASELKEKESKLEAQLEEEKKESAKLSDALAALKKEAQKRQEEKEKEEESKAENVKLKEILVEMEIKGEEREEEVLKIKKELEALQSALSCERKEREKEREEENKRLTKYQGGELMIAELQAELDRLQKSARGEEKIAKDNMPLTYLQLGDQPNDTKDIATFESSLISSPDVNISFCESANLQNAVFCKDTALITECGPHTKLAGLSRLRTEGSISSADLNKPAKSGEVTDLDDTTVLILEVERMRVQRDKEAERAAKIQKKLELLQNQVTSQTQQLSLAFDSQSKHIEGLLRELQERNDTLRTQGDELRSCQEEIVALKSKHQVQEEVGRVASSQEGSGTASGKIKEDDVRSDSNRSAQEAGRSPNHARGGDAFTLFDERNSPDVSVPELCKEKSSSIPDASDVYTGDGDSQTETLKTLTPVQPGSGKVLEGNSNMTEETVPLNMNDGQSESNVNVNKTQQASASSKVLNLGRETHTLVLEVADVYNSDVNSQPEVITSAQPGSGQQVDNNNKKVEERATQSRTNGQSDSSVNVNKADQVSASSEVPDFGEEQASLVPDTSVVCNRDGKTLTVAQTGCGQNIDANNKERQSPSKPELQLGISESLQKLLEHPPADIHHLKQVIHELHQTQKQLSTLKDEHERLTLQLQEMSREDLLSIKQENEELKLKLKRTEAQMCSSRGRDSDLVNTKPQDWSGRKGEVPTAGGGNVLSKDGGERSGESEDPSGEQTSSLQEQLQALQTQIQLLSQQNRAQAEELDLWKLSAQTPGEDADPESNGDPIVLVREDQLVLSCASRALRTHDCHSRSLVQHGGLTQLGGKSNPETGQGQREGQLMSNATRDSQFLLTAGGNKELTADHHSTEASVNNHQKMDVGTMEGNSTLLTSSCAAQNSNDGHGFVCSVQSAELGANIQQNASVSCEKQCLEKSFQKEQENASDETKFQTNDPKVIQEVSDWRESRTSNDERVSRQGHVGCERADAAGDDLVLREEDADQTSESAAVARELRSACTQTEECEREAEESVNVLHAATQTDAEEVQRNEDEEEDEIEPTDSPPLSPAVTAVEPEKLLFSGSFPIPADPAHLAERIRRSRSRISAAYDDTEYEPYGLPEVVMKGFADIPSGPACPYVLRRGLLGTDALPLSLRDIRDPPLREEEDEEEIDP